nr:hypothetical protein [Tanacetum cinerariifolium]
KVGYDCRSGVRGGGSGEEWRKWSNKEFAFLALQLAFLALQLAFSSVFLALLTVTAFGFFWLRHASRFCRPLFHELSHTADSHGIGDQLSMLFWRKIAKDLVKIEDYFKLSDELRIGVDMGGGYISELQISDMSKEVLKSIEILRLMQVHDMEKASCLAFMARKIQVKVYEKNTFIVKLRE